MPKKCPKETSNTKQINFRAANEDEIYEEDEIMEDEIVDLPPQKGHSHNHHGHSHEHHGHSHGGHGHSHGGVKEPKLSPEELKKHRERIHKIWDEDDEEDECCRSGDY